MVVDNCMPIIICTR